MAKEFVIYDTEFTSWEGCVVNGWDVAKNQYRELVQIGALRIDEETFKILDTFQAFCKPTKNPLLSEYFKNLTGINQSDVDTAESLEKVIEKFTLWVGARPLFAYGDDFGVIKSDCGLKGVNLQINDTKAHNIKEYLKSLGFPTHQYNSGILTTYYGLQNIGKEHNALADALNIHATLEEMRKRSEFVEISELLNKHAI